MKTAVTYHLAAQISWQSPAFCNPAVAHTNTCQQ